MVSIPLELAPIRVVEGDIVPVYLSERDHGWLRDLIDAFDAFVGRPRRELAAWLRDARGDGRTQAAARVVLEQLFRSRVDAGLAPARARAAWFAAAADRAPLGTVRRRAAARLGVEPAAIEHALFADLPGERLVTAPVEPPGPHSVALQVNLAVVQALLRCAADVEVALLGNARTIVRHARLRGLICTVEVAPAGHTVLRLSGPLSLFRRTALYGRALAELAPQLAWCRSFRLTARCRDPRRVHDPSAPWSRFVTDHRAPIRPSAEPRRYDSRLEQRFVRDFTRLGTGWEVIREPEPVGAGGTIIFPDFEVRRRDDPRRRCWVEIVGFWTRGYLERKLAHLRAAGLERLVLCIDADRACSDGALPTGAFVVPFRRRVDAAAVLAAVETATR